MRNGITNNYNKSENMNKYAYQDYYINNISNKNLNNDSTNMKVASKILKNEKHFEKL